MPRFGGERQGSVVRHLLPSGGRLQSIDGVEVVVFLEEPCGLDVTQLVDRARG